MAFRFGPSIITDGIILHLDPANPASYVSGSSTIYDISGKENHGTLYNGPAYTSENNGGIIFDGTNDFIKCAIGAEFQAITNQITWGGFIKFNTLPTARSQRYMFWDIGYQGVVEIYWRAGINKICVEIVTSTGRTRVESVITPVAGTIYHIVGMYNGTTLAMYLNGKLESSTSKTGNILVTSSGGFFFGETNISNFNVYLNATIYNLQIYNRALSASEILQNYNATKDRFGL